MSHPGRVEAQPVLVEVHVGGRTPGLRVVPDSAVREPETASLASFRTSGSRSTSLRPNCPNVGSDCDQLIALRLTVAGLAGVGEEERAEFFLRHDTFWL